MCFRTERPPTPESNTPLAVTAITLVRTTHAGNRAGGSDAGLTDSRLVRAASSRRRPGMSRVATPRPAPSAICALLAALFGLFAQGLTETSQAASRREPSRGAASANAEQQCLAMAMYWEARGEGLLGMTAVGWTVLNRMR